MAAQALRASRPDSNRLASALGAGSTLIVTSVRTASVPHDPAISLDRSYPVTFFTTRPPALMISPRPVTAAIPRT